MLIIGSSCSRGQVRIPSIKLTAPTPWSLFIYSNASFPLQLCWCYGGGKEIGWSRKQVSSLGRCCFCCWCVPGRLQHAVSTATSTVDYPVKPGKYQKLSFFQNFWFLLFACQGCQVWGHCRWVRRGLVLMWEVSTGTCQVSWWPFYNFRLLECMMYRTGLIHLLMITRLLQLAFKFGLHIWLCWCFITLLCWLLVRMENSVLGNALEGVPEESEGEEQPNYSKIESADNLDGKY